MELSLYLYWRVFGQSHICSSIISCLIIGAIFGSEDRALLVPPNIAPTDIIFTLIKILTVIFNCYCRHSLHNKQLEHLCPIKLLFQHLLPTMSQDISPDIEGWGDKHIVRQLTVSPAGNRAGQLTIERQHNVRGGMPSPGSPYKGQQRHPILRTILPGYIVLHYSDRLEEVRIKRLREMYHRKPWIGLGISTGDSPGSNNQKHESKFNPFELCFYWSV